LADRLSSQYRMHERDFSGGGIYCASWLADLQTIAVPDLSPKMTGRSAARE
jgi:hypothetical protein